MERRSGYYVARIGLVGGLFVAGWAAFVAIGDSWAQLPMAVFLAIMFTQVALLAHDLAHGQVFRTRRASAIAGRIAGNLLIGLGYGWWQDKHTRHHANPNHEERDPDVAPDVLVWSRRQAANAGGLAAFVGKRQAFLFFPLLTLEGLNLHVSSVRAAWRRREKLEGFLLFAHFALYLGLVFAVLPFGLALLFLVIHQACFGVYLGCTFAPNHKGMPVLTNEDDLDFLRKQVLTSRNVTGGYVVDHALGGLNYQIEHHLFPSMPMPNLRRAQPIVQAYCAELGVDYLECGLVASWGQALRHLHEVGEPLRAR